jgi:dTDP-4-dehydrorhamnose reductase
VGDRVVVNPIYVCHECYACRHGYPNLCERLVLYGCGPALEGAYAEYTRVPEYTVFPIPDTLPFDRAAIVEPAAVALHALRISNFKAGDDAVVFGAGPLGLLLISQLKATGANRIFAVAHAEARRALAAQFGADLVLDPDTDQASGPVSALIREQTGGGAAVSFDMAGADETLRMGLEVLKPRGELIMAALPDKALALNRALPAALAFIARSRPLHLVHFSTDFVFDGRKGKPYTEDDAPNPLSAYGRSKLAGEDAIREADLPGYTIIRTAWLFGGLKKNFVRAILGKCREREEAEVVHDQTGSPTYSVDLAQYTLALMEQNGDAQKARGLFHIVNSGRASWSELADEAVTCSQLECRITPVPSARFPSSVTRPVYSVLDCGRFIRVTGIVPRPWPQALREYLMLDIDDGV